MKNLFLALVFFVGTTMSFASSSNEIAEEDFGTCTVTITFYDEDGNVTGTSTSTYWASDATHCAIITSQVAALFNKR